MHSLALLTALPLAGFLVNGLLGARLPKWLVASIACALPALAFVVSVALFAQLARAGTPISQTLFTWAAMPDFNVEAAFYFDEITAVMCLIVTGIGTLIHIYSIGYMAHDAGFARYFAYLNLFLFFMLMLVLGKNLVVVFVGWEGVGLASYLLIGFWFTDPAKTAAGLKAFVVNRVGDTGFVLAAFLLFGLVGSFDFQAINAYFSGAVVAPSLATAIGLLLLLGVCGKSAQIPLHVWLPDAMAGPTPVSALIHAATMVTAGVYLVVRSHAIFDASPDAQLVVVIVGAVTLLFGAVIGCAKDDIKKALAASTMSQIGYMILAAGLGPVGYAFAILHLLAHGFFKANLFLGAGSVMHGMNDDVNMRHYGALQKAMPVTFLTFAMGYLAIIGFPGFSGFWSKDKIIEAAFSQNSLAGTCALIGAAITGFYMTRLMLLTFFTDKRWEKDVHPHESPKVMTVPLIVLAALSVLGGLLLLGDWIVDWLAPVVGEQPEENLPVPAIVFSLLVVAVVAIGVALAWFLVGRREVPREAPTQVSVFTRAARADLYGDAFNEEFLMRPGDRFVNGLVAFDEQGVDGAAEGTATAFAGIAGGMRRLQNGYVRSYALSLLGGAALVLLALLVVNI